MQETVEILKNTIEKMVNFNKWEITHFTYDAKNCSDISDAGPGMWCNLKYYNKTWRLYYPVKDYPTLPDLIDALNCDVAFFNAAIKYPELSIYGSSLANNELQIIHPITHDVRVLVLKEIYYQKTGIIDADELQQLTHQAWRILATTRNYAYQGIPSIISSVKIPDKIKPAFFLSMNNL